MQISSDTTLRVVALLSAFVAAGFGEMGCMSTTPKSVPARLGNHAAQPGLSKPTIADSFAAPCHLPNACHPRKKKDRTSEEARSLYFCSRALIANRGAVRRDASIRPVG